MNVSSANPDPESLGTKRRRPPSVEPLALSPEAAAEALSISRDHLDQLEAMGKTPQPLKLGARKIYNRRELQAWLDAGCPDRATFERQKSRT